MSRSSAIPLSDISSRTSYHGLDSHDDNPFDDPTQLSSRDTLHTKAPDTDVYRPESPIDHDKGNIAQDPTLTKRSLYECRVTDSWGLEILGWLVAALMLATLLILLYKFDKKPLSQWHSRLSLNTIIAVLSQLVQACLLLPIARGISQLRWLWYRKNKPLADMSYFDEGSRGVIGSLLLLSKRYTSLLVWLGVIPMVLQLFIGPFAQQALSLPERQIHPGEATIPRVLRYGTDNSDDVIKDDIQYPDVPLPMKLAISTGLSRDGVTDSEVRGWSSTGNCTFDIFTSMGVCASVEDVTSTITSRCPKGKSGSTVTDDKCNATVKGLQESPPFESFSSYMPERGETLWIRSSRYKHNLNSDNGYQEYQDSSNILVEFYVIYVPDINALTLEDGDLTVPYAVDKLQALKGTLSLCSYTYNSSIEFGNTKTSVLDRNTKLSWNKGYLHLNETNVNGIVAKTSDGSETLFMHPPAMTGLNLLLARSTFTGTATMLPLPTNVPGSGIGNATSPNMFSTEASKAVANYLYDGDSGKRVTDGVKAMSDLLNNLATSMTNGLRTTSVYPSNQTGQSYTYEVYFDVSWSWLVVPILSAPLTIIFLGIVILSGRRHEVPAWKTSQLASLQVLNPSVRAALGGGICRQSVMEKLVEHEGIPRVRLNVLDRGQGKWELAS